MTNELEVMQHKSAQRQLRVLEVAREATLETLFRDLEFLPQTLFDA